MYFREDKDLKTVSLSAEPVLLTSTPKIHEPFSVGNSCRAEGILKDSLPCNTSARALLRFVVRIS